MKLYELAYLNVEKDKNSINFGIMDKFINGKTSHNLVKKSKQEKEEVICYLNGRAMTKSKLEKTFPKKKKNKSKRKYIKKKNHIFLSGQSHWQVCRIFTSFTCSESLWCSMQQFDILNSLRIVP